MKIKKNVPLVCTADPAIAQAYYERHFGFRTIFDSGNFVVLRSADGAIEMSFTKPGKEEMMTPYNSKSLVFCFEVDDVDASYRALCNSGLTFVQPPTDNSWGDRSAITVDPLGIQVYVYSSIPVSDRFKAFVKE
ncbi:MAG: VOC family protein [Deltaproteobacteria bacterium]|nr:VOC family protein [Deltaproteobacteria bacterium]